MNCWTGQASSDSIPSMIVLPTVRCRSDPTGPEVRLVTYKVEDLLLVPVPTFPNSPANLVPGIFSTDVEYAGDQLVGMQLSPTCHLGTGGFDILLHGHQLHLLVITVNSEL